MGWSEEEVMKIDPHKDAQNLKSLIDKGHVSEDDIPLLVNEGLSPETVAIYWKNKEEDKMSVNVQEVIDKLTNAISYKFKDDGTSPGLTISRLKQGQYYCSVIRYPSGGSSLKHKVVVCKAEAGTLDAAVKAVAQAFLIHADHKPNPIEELAELTGLNKAKLL